MTFYRKTIQYMEPKIRNIAIRIIRIDRKQVKTLITERPYTATFSTYLYNRQLRVKYNLQESS